MSEPYLPVPPPERDTYWDPTPARCPECRAVIDAHPASRADGHWEGWCPEHGTVIATYLSQDSEIADRKEDE